MNLAATQSPPAIIRAPPASESTAALESNMRAPVTVPNARGIVYHGIGIVLEGYRAPLPKYSFLQQKLANFDASHASF